MPDELFQEELVFWDRELSLRGDFAEGVRNRLDPERMHLNYPVEILPYLDDLRARFSGRIRVIDVGSGPLSMLALGAREDRYDLTCVDPLADEYAALLRQHGHQPPWPLVACYGEDLAEHFPPSHFHLAWSNNALDHTHNPFYVMRNIVSTLIPGGLAVVQAWECEGSAQGWRGLHRHDLQLSDDGRLVCRRSLPGGALSEFRDVAEDLPVFIHESLRTVRGERHYLRAVFRKQEDV